MPPRALTTSLFVARPARTPRSLAWRVAVAVVATEAMAVTEASAVEAAEVCAMLTRRVSAPVAVAADSATTKLPPSCSSRTYPIAS